MAPNATFLELASTEVTHMLKDKWDFNPTLSSSYALQAAWNQWMTGMRV